MKISLDEYATELEYWIKAFDALIERESVSSMKDVHQRLLMFSERAAEFQWSTPRPVKLKLADEYDRAEGKVDPVQVAWEFQGRFLPIPKAKKEAQIWDVVELTTSIKVNHLVLGKTILQFHHDLKTKGQLGPHMHVQISERFLEQLAGARFAVPRFPATALLPTDCLDMALSEFFPHVWPKVQSGAHRIGMLRERQITRIRSVGEALMKEWGEKQNRTPISLLQNCYFPELRLA